MGDGAASPEKLSVIEPHSGPPIDERVAKLETNLSTLVDSIKSLAGTVSEGFAESRRDRGVLQEEHKRDLRGVQQEISRERESRRPQYQTQAAWAAVVLTIVFGAWALTSKGYDSDRQRLEASLAELQATRLQSSYERGLLEGRLSGAERAVIQLDASLQNEMDAHVKRLDDKLQIEMAGQRDVQQKDIDWVKDRLDKLVGTYVDLNKLVQARGEIIGRLEESQAWVERGLERDLELAARNRSDLDQAIVRQQERAATFDELKRRVLALEENP